MNQIKFKDTQSNDVLFEKFSSIEKVIDDYKASIKDKKPAIEITDEKALKMWKDKIKPLSDKMEPHIDEMIKLDEEKSKMEAEYKELMEKMDATQKTLDALKLKRNKFITRISPIIIRMTEGKLTKYQQPGSIIEEGGKVFVTIHDWFGAWLTGQDKKLEQHDEKVAKKVHPKMAAETE